MGKVASTRSSCTVDGVVISDPPIRDERDPEALGGWPPFEF
jgi:hypothetical protein